MNRKATRSASPTGKARPGRPKSPIRKRPAAARAPGRPRIDGADQRARLIDAALTCYVRAGIKATSIRNIATEAGVTPALVHYYFGDSRRLLQRVVEERLMPVFLTVREPLQQIDARDPVALITTFVQSICRAIEMHPWWPALWVREVISEGGSLRDLLVKRVAPDLMQGVARQFAAAQARGQLNKDLDPRLLVVSVIGLTLFPAAGAPIWRSILDAKDLTMNDVRQHALALLTRGIEVKS